MAIIIGTYYGFFLPSIVDSFVDYDENIKRYMFHIFNAIFYFNAILNPAIYAWVNTDFRNAFKKILRLKSKPNVTGSVATTTNVTLSTWVAQSQRNLVFLEISFLDRVFAREVL